jgi:hypothetical protein
MELPDRSLATLQIPGFSLSAAGDSSVPTDQVTSFAYSLQEMNPRVTLVRVPSGDHYYSMLIEGIPRAIEWLEKLSN